MKSSIGRAVAGTITAGLVGAWSSEAAGAKVVVRNCASDVQLRAKLAELQSGAGGKVKFKCGASPPAIVLGSPLTISKKVTIDGGARGITLSGADANLLVIVAASATARLRNLTLTNGFNPSSDGGAIVNSGILTIERCRLTENEAAVGSGGAILSFGPLTIVDSELDHNKAANGGAIYPRFANAVTVLARSRVHDNETTSAVDGWGGAVLVWDGASLSVNVSEITDNHARHGGGVYVSGIGSRLSSTESRWERNQALVGKGGAIRNEGTTEVLQYDLFSINSAADGGAIYNEKTLTVTKAFFDRNDGGFSAGALRNEADATIDTTTFIGNQTSGQTSAGGAIYNRGTLDLKNVTMSDNAAVRGGALMNDAANALARLNHVTMFDNAASQYGGAIAFPLGEVRVVSSIVAGSTSGENCNKPAQDPGSILSLGFNLTDSAACGFAVVTDQLESPVKLGALANNGGFAKSHMPKPGGKAVDKGEGAPCLVDADQRETPRPQGAACDIGALESCPAGKPAPFQLVLSPGQTLQPGFGIIWSVASCATSYELVLREDSSSGDVVFSRTQGIRGVLLPDFLVGPRNYAVQVKACNKQKCRSTPWVTFFFTG
jgi:hypothetical protein